MPKIFQTIDLKMRERFIGERTENILPSIPPGLMKHGERWVESRPITFSNHITSCYIRGKLDGIIAFDNATFGVVDFKTSKPTKKHSEFYFRQLNAYAYCLENAGKSKFALRPISKLGLLVFEPTHFENLQGGGAIFQGNLSWIDVELNPDAFLAHLKDVLKVLERTEPPETNANCAWCQYRDGG